MFPLTRDELVEATAVLRAVRRGELDRLHVPELARDILIQQVVAACIAEPWDVKALYELGNWTQCVRVGASASDGATKALVRGCKTRLADQG